MHATGDSRLSNIRLSPSRSLLVLCLFAALAPAAAGADAAPVVDAAA